MKVLQLYNTTRPFFENQLAALERRGIECTRLSVPGKYAPDSSRSVRDYARFLPDVLGESLGGYDLVHANYGLVAPFALAQPTRPVVVTLWGSDLMGDATWLNAMSRWTARLADGVVLPSRAMSPYLPCDHAIVPFAVDTDQFRPIPREEARGYVDWEPDGRYALFPYDTNRPVKDFARARRVVERADVDVELKQVSGVPHREMPYYLNASDAVLVTSRHESGPMVVKEAAACNVPVVSTDVGFVRRTLSGVDQSAVCTSDAELTRALEDVLVGPGRSDARERVDEVGLDAMGERLVEVYRRAMGDDGSTTANVPRDRPTASR